MAPARSRAQGSACQKSRQAILLYRFPGICQVKPRNFSFCPAGTTVRARPCCAALHRRGGCPHRSFPRGDTSNKGARSLVLTNSGPLRPPVRRTSAPLRCLHPRVASLAALRQFAFSSPNGNGCFRWERSRSGGNEFLRLRGNERSAACGDDAATHDASVAWRHHASPAHDAVLSRSDCAAVGGSAALRMRRAPRGCCTSRPAALPGLRSVCSAPRLSPLCAAARTLGCTA